MQPDLSSSKVNTQNELAKKPYILKYSYNFFLIFENFAQSPKIFKIKIVQVNDFKIYPLRQQISSFRGLLWS